MGDSLSLIDVPRTLRAGITRRLPIGNRFKDITGQQFKRCVVLGFAGYKGKYAVWLCRCVCGNQFIRQGVFLRQADTHGCGCLRPDRAKVAPYLVTTWHSIKSYCYEPSDAAYHDHGNRGIKVCKRWLDSLECFAADMGPRPSEKHVIARRNESGDFKPSNCFWATKVDKRFDNGRIFNHAGKSQSLAAWARELGISREAMRKRVNACVQSSRDLSIAFSPKRQGKACEDP